MSVEGTVFRVVVTELETEIMVLEGAVEVVHRSSPGSFRRLAAGRTGFADHRSLQSSAALTPELCERRTTLLRTYVEWVEHQMRG
jgi:ferric-dicitrate binding protein FerR (iron transport regulator)